MKNTIVKFFLCAMLVLAFSANQQAHAAEQVKSQPTSSIPMLSRLVQVSPNQLQVTYDQPVDQAKGMDPKNYWIQSTAEQTPTNIATLGMNDTVSNSNALTPDKVTIQRAGNDGKTFVLTFKTNIAKGMAFKMIICYVTKPGMPPYTGGNGSASFIGQ